VSGGKHSSAWIGHSPYLEHFDGRPATSIGDVPGGIQGPAASATPDGFARLQRALGLDAQAAEGESVRLTPAGIAPIEGVVDYLRPNFPRRPHRRRAPLLPGHTEAPNGDLLSRWTPMDSRLGPLVWSLLTVLLG
jgi:hypothetical protein